MPQPIPLVIIHCLAYNQASYIRQCLDGFVMQRTTFPFYAVVHDDASTDGTADIIREYAEKYPDIIHPIFETQNLWRQGKGMLSKVMDEACAEATYLAYCEGDDYWTDPLKLQKQVDFMETHPDFSICYHEVAILDEKSGELDYSNAINEGIPEESTIVDLAKNNYIHTPSVLYRYSPATHQKMRQIGGTPVLDYARNLFYAEQGKIKRLPECMAVYRYGVGIWTGRATPFNRSARMLILLAKMAPLVSHPEARDSIERGITLQYNCLVQAYRSEGEEIYRLRHTKAYRLGKWILNPFASLKRRFVKH